MRDYDTVHYRGRRLSIGTFTCRREQPSFEHTGPAHGYLFVFPRLTVGIEQEGADPFIADPSSIVFYNRGVDYERRAVSDFGDRADWFAVARDDVVAAASEHDPAVPDDPDRAFRMTHGPSSMRLSAARREMIEAARAPERDELAIEEAAQAMLAEALALAYGAQGRSARPARPSTRRAHADLVSSVRALLADRYREAMALDDIASRVHVAPAHLCRVFRSATGMTLSAYQTRLRLAASLDMLASGRMDLTSVALDLGFCSHAHFTDRFRDALGLSPSAFRERLERAGACEFVRCAGALSGLVGR